MALKKIQLEHCQHSIWKKMMTLFISVKNLLKEVTTDSSSWKIFSANLQIIIQCGAPSKGFRSCLLKIVFQSLPLRNV